MSTPVSDAAAAPPPVHVRYMLEADAAPGLLARVLAPFARCDLTPDRMWSHRSADDMHVEIAFDALQAEYAALMEGHLRRIVGVRTVIRLHGVARMQAAMQTAA